MPSLLQLPEGARAKVFFHGIGAGKVVADSLYIYFSDFGSLEATRRITLFLGRQGEQTQSPASGKHTDRRMPLCQEENCSEWIPKEGLSFCAYLGFARKGGIRHESYARFLVPQIGPNPTKDKVKNTLPLGARLSGMGI